MKMVFEHDLWICVGCRHVKLDENGSVAFHFAFDAKKHIQEMHEAELVEPSDIFAQLVEKIAAGEDRVDPEYTAMLFTKTPEDQVI